MTRCRTQTENPENQIRKPEIADTVTGIRENPFTVPKKTLKYEVSKRNISSAAHRTVNANRTPTLVKETRDLVSKGTPEDRPTKWLVGVDSKKPGVLEGYEASKRPTELAKPKIIKTNTISTTPVRRPKGLRSTDLPNVRNYDGNGITNID